MIAIPFLYFLVIFGVIYLLGRRKGPNCLERADRYAEEHAHLQVYQEEEIKEEKLKT
jgi:hypothetical protein